MSTSEQPEMIVHMYSISITNRAICSRVAFILITFFAYVINNRSWTDSPTTANNTRIHVYYVQ